MLQKIGFSVVSEQDKMDEAEGGGKKQFKICARQDPCSGDNESKDKPYCSFL